MCNEQIYIFTRGRCQKILIAIPTSAFILRLPFLKEYLKQVLSCCHAFSREGAELKKEKRLKIKTYIQHVAVSRKS